MFRTLKLRGQPGKAETEIFERLRDAQDLLATHVQTLVLYPFSAGALLQLEKQLAITWAHLSSLQTLVCVAELPDRYSYAYVDQVEDAPTHANLHT